MPLCPSKIDLEGVRDGRLFEKNCTLLYRTAKPSLAFFFEGIAIRDTSKQIKAVSWPGIGYVLTLLSRSRDEVIRTDRSIELDSIFLKRREVASQGPRGDAKIGVDSNVVCGRLPGVFDFEPCHAEDCFVRSPLEVEVSRLNTDISSQLAFGSSIRAPYQSNRGHPQHPCNDSEEPLARFDTEKRGLLSVVGGLLAAYGIFELMLGINLWSLAVWVM
ncbi:hypothetical protein A4A58_13330 [Tardiphaga robiniae]|uniref:Uncharacterized protein n=2 Tax=Tardiphaga robiniae TaxID=943830 RepID=A0A161QZ17_9BRAD|nr:hypothetical protein A4A58_13330 [Tardiphaga robiniae]